jgi:hypothetical protein
MSALLLEKNGRVSSSKQSKHIKAKYFLIKDYYHAGEVDLKYCSKIRCGLMYSQSRCKDKIQRYARFLAKLLERL